MFSAVCHTCHQKAKAGLSMGVLSFAMNNR